MKKKRDPNHDEDMPIGPMRVVKNFLPPPDQLIFPDQSLEKVTILIDRTSLNFYKAQAKRHGLKYQPMIREVLRLYAQKHTPDKAA